MTSPFTFTDALLQKIIDGDDLPALSQYPAMARELLEARKDARRYRWLREGSHGMDKPFITVLDKGYVLPFKQEQLDLDAAIDAALAEGK